METCLLAKKRTGYSGDTRRIEVVVQFPPESGTVCECRLTLSLGLSPVASASGSCLTGARGDHEIAEYACHDSGTAAMYICCIVALRLLRIPREVKGWEATGPPAVSCPEA